MTNAERVAEELLERHAALRRVTAGLEDADPAWLEKLRVHMRIPAYFPSAAPEWIRDHATHCGLGGFLIHERLWNQPDRIKHDLAIHEREETSGCVVYFVQAYEDSPIKIGTTTAAKLSKRLSQLQVGNPDPLDVLATLPGGVHMESELHARFAHLRKSGEWFRPEPELLALIDSIKERA